jgi:alkylation response protein AidB-like acyl-CoA dehydrogenase
MSQDLREREAGGQPHQHDPEAGQTFVEVALTLGGKTAEEAAKTGKLDRADEQVEALFAPQYQTVNSPIHRAVWDRELPVDLFNSRPSDVPESCARVMDRSIEVVRRHRDAGTLFNAERKIDDAVLRELAEAGYWGLLVDREYGGQGAPFSAFAPFLTRMATVDATVAGLASVHGCIGAVDPVRTFGSPEQKSRILPRLASGERLSAFALTEPGAGSDLTALRTTARLDGDDYVVNGEKLFITNAVPGRTVGLVCLIEGKPSVLIADLPDHEDEHFQIKRYGLFALKHSYNNGLLFRDFRVPAVNLLRPTRGDGLTVAYHGLNLGRVALCATAAGSMRVMLANMLPWAHFRRTYGEAIERRELVRRRIARLAALIAGCDALVAWCSWLLDSGYRGEMECIIAKIFGSEAQKEAAIELFMKTHGGRAFLHGHMFGENVHEYLAPCIYEGEGEMLGMAFLKSLIKEHGKTYFEPVGRALAASGIKKPNLMNPAHAWALRKAIAPYAKWRLAQMVSGRPAPEWPRMPDALRAHAAFASEMLAKSRLEISATMTKHQLKLADRQCRIAELSQRIQDMVVILAASLWASRQENDLVREAADLLCQDLTNKLTGRRPSDRYFRQASKLGEAIAAGGYPEIAGVATEGILMPYANEEPTPAGNGRG